MPTAANEKSLPNAIVIGAMKCGTTSLHRNLGLHPDVSASARKELNFFCDPSASSDPARMAAYARQFDARARVRVESSPHYSKAWTFPGTAARIARRLPDVRLIYLMRDPIDRIVSHFQHRVTNGFLRGPLADALERLEDNPLVEPSRYHAQLEAYLEHFPASRIHLICFEQLRDEPDAVMADVFHFLGIDPDFRSDLFRTARNQATDKQQATRLSAWLQVAIGRKPARRLRRTPLAPLLVRGRAPAKPVVDEATRRRLEAFLADDLAKLRAQTGRAFDEWSV